MFDKGIKPKWWSPLIFLLIPGSCYAYAAYYPSFNIYFTIIGIILTIAVFVFAIWRVVRPKQTETHFFRLFSAQVFTLWLLLIPYRFWNTLFPKSSLVAGTILLAIYLVAWILPFYKPIQSQYLYREFMWFPNRVISIIIIIIGGVGGGQSAIIGMDSSKFGSFALLFAAVLTTALLASGNFYFAAHLWRIQQGKSPVPSYDE